MCRLLRASSCKLIINIFCSSLTSSNTADNATTTTTTTTITTQHCPVFGKKGNTKALRKAVFVCDSQGLFGQDSAQYNEEVQYCCCSSGPNTIKILKFFKARGHRTHSVTHYFPCEACRNKPCLQKSARSALGSVFMLLSRSPASSHRTGDSHARL